jgi:hypothetical protein
LRGGFFNFTFGASSSEYSLNTFDFGTFFTVAVNSEEDEKSEKEIFHKEES